MLRLVPTTVHLNNMKYTGDTIPDAFARYFEDKVNNITEIYKVDNMVYNGHRLTDVNDENFMDEAPVKKVIKTVKV